MLPGKGPGMCLSGQYVRIAWAMMRVKIRARSRREIFDAVTCSFGRRIIVNRTSLLALRLLAGFRVQFSI